MRIISGLSAVAAQYDVISLDQFGVLHNGGVLLPGVYDALAEMRAIGKKFVIVSNTSRRKETMVKALIGKGFPEEWLSSGACSGERCYQALCDQQFGNKCLFLGWNTADRGAETSFLDGTGLVPTTALEADLVVAYGPNTIFSDGQTSKKTEFMLSGSVDEYMSELAVAAKRRLPFYCANSDFVSVTPTGDIWHMTGTIAQAYESLGGDVLHFGKPHAEIFLEALEPILIEKDAQRLNILHVGDSLEHDVKGATAANIDSLFVVDTGIHSEHLADWQQQPQQDATRPIADLARSLRTPTPTLIIDRFKW